MLNWPPSLVREIADRRALVFVGSGLSKAAHTVMPTWSQLLGQLTPRLPKKADQALVKSLIRKERLLDAAQVLTDGLNRADLTAQLTSTFQIRPVPHHELYRSLLLLDLKFVVTTNYDEFLERNFDFYSGGVAAYNVCKHTSRDLLDKVRSPQRAIAKIHGCITEPADLVLDRNSYFNAKRERHSFYSVMSALFMTHTVLFLGYSLSDPDLQLILENANAVSSSNHGHYALMPKLEHRSLARAIKHSFNIDCIEYPSGRHDCVPQCLAGLEAAVREDRLSRGIA